MPTISDDDHPGKKRVIISPSLIQVPGAILQNT